MNELFSKSCQISGDIQKRPRTWFFVTAYTVLNNPEFYEWKHGSLWRKVKKIKKVKGRGK